MVRTQNNNERQVRNRHLQQVSPYVFEKTYTSTAAL